MYPLGTVRFFFIKSLDGKKGRKKKFKKQTFFEKILSRESFCGNFVTENFLEKICQRKFYWDAFVFGKFLSRDILTRGIFFHNATDRRARNALKN